MFAKLVNVDSSRMISEIPLVSLPITIGRGAQADVQISDQWASRVHCRIVSLQEQFVVQDLGSTGGTLVNGQPIVEAMLNHGDLLTVGITSFRVQLKSGARLSVFKRISDSVQKLSLRPRTSHAVAAVCKQVTHVPENADDDTPLEGANPLERSSLSTDEQHYSSTSASSQNEQSVLSRVSCR